MKSVFTHLSALALIVSIGISTIIPQSAAAQSSSIQQLLAQIAQLQQQVQALGTGTSTGCYTFTRDLTIGSQGADVTALQNYLHGTGHYTFASGATGYFGPVTQTVVAAWQRSQAITPAVGYFGSLSRARYAVTCTPTTPTTPTPTTPTTSTPGTVKDNREAEVRNFSIEEAPSTLLEEGDKKVQIAHFEFEVDDAPVTLDRLDVVVDPVTSNLEDDPWKTFSKLHVSYEGEVIKTLDVGNKKAWNIDNYDNDSDDEFRVRFTGLKIEIPEGDQTVEILADIQNNLNGLNGGNQQEWEIMSPSSAGLRFVSPNGLSETKTTNSRVQIEIQEIGSDAELRVARSKDTPDSSLIEVKTNGISQETDILEFTFRAEDATVTLEEVPFIVDIIRGDNATVTSASNAETLFSSMINNIYLSIDGNRVGYEKGSVSYAAVDINNDSIDDARARIVFDLSKKDIEIDADETMEATISIVFKSIGSGSTNYPTLSRVRVGTMNADNLSTSLNENTIDAIEAESSDEELDASQLSGSAISDYFFVAKSGVSASLTSSEVTGTNNQNGQTVKTVFVARMNIAAIGDSFYVPLGATTTTAGGFTYTVEDPNTGQTKNTFSADAVTSAFFSTKADQETNSSNETVYRIEEGEVEEFVVYITLNSNGGTMTGAHRIQFLSVQASDDIDGTPVSYQLLPRNQFETGIKTLDN